MSNVFRTLLNNVVSQGLVGDLPALQNAVSKIPIAFRRPIVACTLFNNKSIHDKDNFLNIIEYLCHICGTLQVEKMSNNVFFMKKLSR